MAQLYGLNFEVYGDFGIEINQLRFLCFLLFGYSIYKLNCKSDYTILIRIFETHFGIIGEKMLKSFEHGQHLLHKVAKKCVQQAKKSSRTIIVFVL